MPLEPGPFGYSILVNAPDRQPTDLRQLASVGITSEDPGQQLPTETDAQDRDVGPEGFDQQVLLPVDPRNGIVEGSELGPERHDQVVTGRIETAVVEIDAVDLDIRPDLLEPLEDQPGRGRLLVLDDEDPQVARRPGCNTSPPEWIRSDFGRDLPSNLAHRGRHPLDHLRQVGFRRREGRRANKC